MRSTVGLRAARGKPMIPLNEADFLHEAHMRICSTLNLETALARCLECVKAVMPADAMGLYVYDRDFTEIRIVATARQSKGMRVNWRVPLSPDAKPALGESPGSDVLVVNGPEFHPLFHTVGRQFGLPDSSFLILRLAGKEGVLGVVSLRASGCGRYSEHHAHLFSLLNDPIAVALTNALEHEAARASADQEDGHDPGAPRRSRPLTADDIIGTETGLKGVMEMVGLIAPMDSPVLLLGETGVGKELIANAIHYASPRRDGPFVKVNCGAIPETLLDSELFGHERGAFTGAVAQKRGSFERADRGTIFLDEVGELRPQAQVRLLRVLQSGEIQRVGGTRSLTLDIRVIAATHRNLEDMVRSGKFREDLWYRLNVCPIVIPPLRERKRDVPALTRYFVDRKSRDLKLPDVPPPADGAIERLTHYQWPGNVRELENIVERALILTRNGPLTFDRFLSNPVHHPAPPTPDTDEKPLTLDQVTANHIRCVLEMTDGRVHGPGGAAEILDVHPSTLRNKMKKLGISFGRRYGKDDAE